jgi:hypothetical protein
MVLLRCAWHRQYWRYPKVYGVVSFRGRYVAFSDGMCRRCSQRWREDWRAVWDEALAPPLVPAWLPRLGLVIVLLSATILSARPLNQSLPLPIPLSLVSGVRGLPPVMPVDSVPDVRATVADDQQQRESTGVGRASFRGVGGDVKPAVSRDGVSSATRSYTRAPSACRCSGGPSCRCPGTRSPRRTRTAPVTPGATVLPQAP